MGAEGKRREIGVDTKTDRGETLDEQHNVWICGTDGRWILGRIEGKQWMCGYLRRMGGETGG